MDVSRTRYYYAFGADGGGAGAGAAAGGAPLAVAADGGRSVLRGGLLLRNSQQGKDAAKQHVWNMLHRLESEKPNQCVDPGTHVQGANLHCFPVDSPLFLAVPLATSMNQHSRTSCAATCWMIKVHIAASRRFSRAEVSNCKHQL